MDTLYAQKLIKELHELNKNMEKIVVNLEVLNKAHRIGAVMDSEIKCEMATEWKKEDKQ